MTILLSWTLLQSERPNRLKTIVNPTPFKPEALSPRLGFSSPRSYLVISRSGSGPGSCSQRLAVQGFGLRHEPMKVSELWVQDSA